MARFIKKVAVVFGGLMLIGYAVQGERHLAVDPATKAYFDKSYGEFIMTGSLQSGLIDTPEHARQCVVISLEHMRDAKSQTQLQMAHMDRLVEIWSGLETFCKPYV